MGSSINNDVVQCDSEGLIINTTLDTKRIWVNYGHLLFEKKNFPASMKYGLGHIAEVLHKVDYKPKFRGKLKHRRMEALYSWRNDIMEYCIAYMRNDSVVPCYLALLVAYRRIFQRVTSSKTAEESLDEVYEELCVRDAQGKPAIPFEDWEYQYEEMKNANSIKDVSSASENVVKNGPFHLRKRRRKCPFRLRIADENVRSVSEIADENVRSVSEIADENVRSVSENVVENVAKNVTSENDGLSSKGDGDRPEWAAPDPEEGEGDGDRPEWVAPEPDPNEPPKKKPRMIMEVADKNTPLTQAFKSCKYRPSSIKNNQRISPTFDKCCFFCASEGHSLYVAKSKNVIQCPEYIQPREGLELCEYKFCYDKGSHLTTACHTLHDHCKICGFRGHHQSLCKKYSKTEFRDEFERTANEGKFTRMRKVDLMWGFYPVNNPGKAEEVLKKHPVIYSTTLRKPVHKVMQEFRKLGIITKP